MTKFSIDSLKIRIPYSNVKILNPAIESNWYLTSEATGETIEDIHKVNSYPIEENGIKTKFAIEKQKTGKTTTDKFLVILFNSKILKSKYFDGIQLSNIRDVYDYLMNKEVVSFSFEEFIKGECTDVDFKKDLIRNDISELLTGLKNLTRERFQEITNKRNSKQNKGIEWNTRRNGSTKNPYLKMYGKFLELTNSSKQFYETYIIDSEADQNIEQIFRIEFTVKNKEMFKKYKIEDTSLSTLLNLESDKLTEIFQKYAEHYLDIYDVKPIEIRAGLNVNQTIGLQAIQLLLDTERVGDVETIVKKLCSSIENRSERTRKRNELLALFNQEIAPSKKKEIEKGKIRQNVLDLIFG